MKKSNRPKTMKKARGKTDSGETIGIDLGDKTSSYCILNAEREVIERGVNRSIAGYTDSKATRMNALQRVLHLVQLLRRLRGLLESSLFVFRQDGTIDGVLNLDHG